LAIFASKEMRDYTGRMQHRARLKWIPRLKSKHRTAIVLWFSLVAIAPAITTFLFSPGCPEQAAFCAAMVMGILGMLVVLALLVTFVAMVLTPIRAARPLALKVFMNSFCAFILLLVSIFVCQSIRLAAGADLSKRSHSLVLAISAYQTLKGHPPRALTDLVPVFLPAVPSTGFGAFPRYLYSVSEYEDPEWWELRVPCSLGGPDFSYFVYRTDRNYYVYNHRFPVEPVGEWVYVHE